MKLETQKLYLNKLLSSPELFARCAGILSPDYFDLEIKSMVKFILKYFNEYNTIPKIDYVNAEYGAEFKPLYVDTTEIKFLSNDIEKFCRREALYKAIRDSVEDVTNEDEDNSGKVLERVQNALAISIQRELGISMFDDLGVRLERYLVSDIYEPTGILGLDEALGGGLSRKQVTLFSANSGGGKSLMMANIGANYVRNKGFHVLQLALELTEQMIDLRNLSILTGVSIKDWKSNILEIKNVMKSHVDNGAGSFIIKRIPGGSNALSIRSYLKLYETEYGRKPDVLIVDYLDLMSPNSGSKNKGIFEQDKEKSEELAEIAFDYDCICISASQQNRDGIKATTPDQSIIAGGISKINTVDNYISIYMNPEMRLKGELFLYYLKTRSSSAVGSMTQLVFNPENLIISDKKITTIGIISQIKERKKNEAIVFPGIEGEIEVPYEMLDVIKDYVDYEESVQSAYNSVKIVAEESKINLEDDTDIWNRSKKIKISGVTDDDLDDFINLINR